MNDEKEKIVRVKKVKVRRKRDLRVCKIKGVNTVRNDVGCDVVRDWIFFRDENLNARW